MPHSNTLFSLSSNTFSQSLKHRNQSSSTSRHATKITLTLKRSPLSSQSASDDPLTHTMKIPFVPTNGSSDFFKFEGMFFL